MRWACPNRYESCMAQNETVSGPQRILVREGLLVEYAPGRAAPADLTTRPCLRAALLVPLLPVGATAVSLSALWIHTGWWPPDRPPAVLGAHPGHSRPPIIFRRSIPTAYVRVIGGLAVTNPARTGADLLLMERTDVAIEGVLRLFDTCLSVHELQAHLQMESRRPGLPRARAIAAQLPAYVQHRRRIAIRSAHARLSAPSHR